MATIQQINANRLNALKSTGPRTASGKAAASLNALKTGIDAGSMVIKGEDPEAWNNLVAEYYEHWAPTNPAERFLLDALITADWFRRRYTRIEGQIWDMALQNKFRDKENPFGDAFNSRADLLLRLQRKLDAAERSYHKSLKELLRIQAARRPEPETRQDAPEAIAPEPLIDELGSFLTIAPERAPAVPCTAPEPQITAPEPQINASQINEPPLKLVA